MKNKLTLIIVVKQIIIRMQTKIISTALIMNEQ